MYLICDNGYLRWPTTICPFTRRSNSSPEEYFSTNIESVHKDMECTFRIIKKRWHTSSLEWELILESLNNEVNICPIVRPFVPLQIIMRTLFRLIICTFCYDISFKCWRNQNPMVIPPRFFGFYGVPTYKKIIRFLSYWFLYLFIADVFCFANVLCFCIKVLCA
jgi:hypothetical protein